MLALTLPAFAQVTPRSIGDCERLKSDLAYNQCLAMFGPEARMITANGGGSANAPDIKVPPAIDTAAATGVPVVEEPTSFATRGRRRFGGRARASFSVAGASDDIPASSGDKVEADPSQSSRRRWRRRR